MEKMKTYIVRGNSEGRQDQGGRGSEGMKPGTYKVREDWKD